MRKIRIAFVKYGGLSAGGSEKFLQIIAANLPKDEFDVDYFYCDASPYLGSDYRHLSTDPHRMEYLLARGVNLIKFNVGAKDVTHPMHTWVSTDFWNHFDERNYDVIHTVRAGHKEYPFCKIRRTPIIDTIALAAGVDNQYNIARVMHVSEWNASQWRDAGGDSSRVLIVSLPVEIPSKDHGDLRRHLGLEGRFIYGLHQRNDDNIFSEIPLLAYKRVEDRGTGFVLLGGGGKYRQQARELDLKNFYSLPHTGDQNYIYTFLNTLNVYSHGRKDGEVNSQAMAEAMYFGLPIVSHFSPINNGHVECIGNAGVVTRNVDEYARELLRLRKDETYYEFRAAAAKRRFQEKYELHAQMQRIIAIYKDVYRNPFPNHWRRVVSSLHYSQNLKILRSWIRSYIKFHRRNAHASHEAS